MRLQGIIMVFTIILSHIGPKNKSDNYAMLDVWMQKDVSVPSWVWLEFSLHREAS